MARSTDSGRGLASADEKTRARVARAGGEAVSRDRGHMAEIGRKGGRASGGNFKNDPKRASRAGREGGRASHGGGRT